MRHTLIIYARVAVACIMLGVTHYVKAQELGATFMAQTKTGVIMTFQLVDTEEMNIQVGTWDGEQAIDTQTKGQVIIPNSAGGMRVVAIAPGAFLGCAGVTAINVPGNVASIGERAFTGMRSLDTLVVSATNAVFDSRNNCNAVIEKATNTLIVGCRGSSIDPTVTSIGPSAFEGSGISSIFLSADITSIGDKAFAGCDSLVSITSLSSAPCAVSADCFSNVETVELYVPLGSKATYMATDGWKSIEHIYEIGAPTEVTDEQGVRYVPQYHEGSYIYIVTRLNEIHSAEVTIPSTLNDYPVTAIGDTAFANRTGMTSITIPASVESIGDKAFVGCNQLTHITMLRPEPPTTALTAFNNINNKTLYVPLGSRTVYGSVNPWSSFTKIEALGAPEIAKIDGVIYTPVVDGDTYTYTISGHEGNLSGSLTLRSDVGGYPVTAIAAKAFKDCTGLTGILTLPSSLISIGDLAFMGCSGFTSSVHIPASVTEIGDNPFAGCKGITAFSVETGNSVYDSRNNSNTIVKSATATLIAGASGSQLPDDIKAIAPYAFYGQVSLLGITIPEGVTSIGEKAFFGCDQITQVSILAPTPPAITEDVFSCYNKATLSVVKGSKAAYSEAIGWKLFSSIDDGTPEYYQLTYIVEGNTIEIQQLIEGQSITPLAYPQREGYTFSGWSNLPATMPAKDVVVTGTFTVNSYKLIYKVDGEEYKTIVVAYGTKLTAESEPTKEGYTFSGWSDLPATMPAHDVTVSGSFLLDSFFYKDGVLFMVSDKNNNAVTLISVPENSVVVVPESIQYQNKNYSVTAIADGAFGSLQQLKSVKIPSSVKTAGKDLFASSPHLAAIIWETPFKMTKEMAGSVANNPNLLFYTPNTAYAPDGVTNVINSQTKQAERIQLTDDGDYHDFYCPEEFSADEISYTHNYKQQSKSGTCQGWEALVLPFDVTEITHEKNGAITPFGALEYGREFENEDTRPFWLYEYKDGGFQEAASIKANVPYIISMPNEASLWRDYVLRGNVTFKGKDVAVKTTSSAKPVKSGVRSFVPNFQEEYNETAYLLNVGVSYNLNDQKKPEGSVFVKELRNAHPFEAYFDLGSRVNTKAYINVFEELTDEIRSITNIRQRNDANVEYYQLDGIKRSKLQRGFNIIRTPDGKTQKVAIK